MFSSSLIPSIVKIESNNFSIERDTNHYSFISIISLGDPSYRNHYYNQRIFVDIYLFYVNMFTLLLTRNKVVMLIDSNRKLTHS
jgi:hypothetical protein